jgi:hypothetical protein
MAPDFLLHSQDFGSPEFNTAYWTTAITSTYALEEAILMQLVVVLADINRVSKPSCCLSDRKLSLLWYKKPP